MSASPIRTTAARHRDALRPALIFAFCLLVGVWAAPAGARPVDVPTPLPPVTDMPARPPVLPVSLSALEHSLFNDASDGRFDEHTLLAAALIAGGVDDAAQIDRYQRRVDAFVERLNRSGEVTGSAKRRAQVIFEAMHREFLRGYLLDATDLQTVLDQGRYNCVSASVLFCYLAGRFGLDVRGLELTGHAMSRLHVGRETFEVESTCPAWFRMTDDPERRANLVAKAIGIRHNPHAPPAHCREVSGVALIATIYYNRGVDLLVQKQFARAVDANIKALWLDPSSDTARGNLLATVNNWAIAEGTARHYQAAVGLLRTGLAIESSFSTFRANFIHVHRQWIESLCRRKQFERSCVVLQAAQRDFPNEPWFAQALLKVYRHWVTNLLAGEQYDRAFAVLDAAARTPQGARWSAQMEVDEISRYCGWLRNQGRDETAAAILARSLRRHPGNLPLTEALQTIAHRPAKPDSAGEMGGPALSLSDEHFVSEESDEPESGDRQSL